MKWSSRIRCRNCRAFNEADRRFCAHCGSPLPRRGYGAGGISVAGQVARGLSVLVLVAVMLGLAYGVYYAADRYFFTALGPDPVSLETVTTVTTLRSTTTTTLREERSASGTNRYVTAVAITQLGFPEGAPTLVLVPGDDHARAICAVPLAAAYGGTVLITPSDGLTTELAAEIERLSPTEVFLVGVARPSRLTNQVQEILADANIKSLGGDDAYQTAALVAAQIKEKLGQVPKVVVVPATGVTDGLAIAPLAGAGGWPILFAREDGSLPRTTTRAISDLEATSALVVGTRAEIDLDDVERQVGASSDETVALVIQYALSQGMSFAHTAITTGDIFPDGVAASCYLARDKGMLLLARDGQLPSELQALYDQHKSDIRTIDFIALPGLANALKAAGSTTTTEAGNGTTTVTTEAR